MLLASISVVHSLSSTTAHSSPSICRYINTKCLPSIARALRNHTITLGDFVWGHMWGVGVEIKVDLVGPTSETTTNGGSTAGADKGKQMERDMDAMDVDKSTRDKDAKLAQLDNVQKQAIEVLSGMYKVRGSNFVKVQFAELPLAHRRSL
jgi:hypothetical protein